METKPATRRSARIQALSLTKIQNVQAGDSAVPTLRRRGGKRRIRNEAIAPPALREDKFMKLEESLIPGISNDVTLAKISTLLPEGNFRTLSSLPSPVGPAWRQALQDRLVYDARVLAHSGDSFVIISDTMSSFTGEEFPTDINLYSLRERTGYPVPPIPQVKAGFPYDCECIALDGKLYVLGGSKNSSYKSPRLGSKDVYVLDLAAQGQWKPCARMHNARTHFRCGAKDGKIYVFGGTCGKRWVRGSEVYDPSVDSWSAITPMRSWPSGNEPSVREKFRDCPLNNPVSTGEEELVVLGDDCRLRSYYPSTDTWKSLSDNNLPPEQPWWFAEFMAEGKLHSMSLRRICVYDTEENRWTERHSCSFPSDNLLLWPISVLAVDNEILAIIDQKFGLRRCLVRSKGFGSDVKKLVWEKLPISFYIGEQNPLICFLKL